MLDPLLCIIVIEAVFREIRSGCPEKLLLPDDLTLICETLQSLKGKLEAWKGALEQSEGSRVSVKKAKMMISSENV